MKSIKKVATTAEAVANEYDTVYLTNDNGKVIVKDKI